MSFKKTVATAPIKFSYYNNFLVTYVSVLYFNYL